MKSVYHHKTWIKPIYLLKRFLFEGSNFWLHELSMEGQKSFMLH